VNVAVGFALDVGCIRQACLVLGGIAPIPWRNLAAEAVLEDLPPSPALAACAAIAALIRVHPLSHNAFKVEIRRDLVEPAIMAVASLLREESDLASDMDMKVKEAERQIDAFFDAQTRIKGLYKPAVIDALLERAELLVTGHRASDERYEQATTALRFNVCNGLNWALRAAHRLCSDRKSRVPHDIDQIALECISDGMSYAFAEDAFYSYWKGYASATFPAEHEVIIRPTGSTLDARLRRFRTNDDIEKPTRETRPNSLLDPDSPIARRFVESLMDQSQVVKGHGFVWSVADEVIKEVAEVFADFIFELVRIRNH
jgi:CO dehydrogenase flavoprotein C-terminal domain